jgi:hypothetical protein
MVGVFLCVLSSVFHGPGNRNTNFLFGNGTDIISDGASFWEICYLHFGLKTENRNVSMYL